MVGCSCLYSVASYLLVQSKVTCIHPTLDERITIQTSIDFVRTSPWAMGGNLFLLLLAVVS